MKTITLEEIQEQEIAWICKDSRVRKTTQKELAEYLNVTTATVSGYKDTSLGKRKLKLMLKGLEKIKEEKELRRKS